MIILFKTNMQYQMFWENCDKEILAILDDMDYEERANTEIAIFNDQEGNTRRFILYPNGFYEDISGTKRKFPDNVYCISLAGPQVLTGVQYDLRGTKVIVALEGSIGLVKMRELTDKGVKYKIEREDGSMFTAYDTDLEVIGKQDAPLIQIG